MPPMMESTNPSSGALSPDVAASLGRVLLDHSRMLAKAAKSTEESARALMSQKEVSVAFVEVTTDVEAMRNLYSEAISQARTQVRAFERSPHLHDPETHVQALGQSESLSRGVVYNVVYDPTVLRHPQLLTVMRESMAMGEHARVTSHLPFRMIISDEELVLVMIEDPDHRMRMCVMRDPAMIALSLRLFERSWDQAIPVPIAGAAVVPEEPSGDTVELLALLAAGLTDEATARQLGVSTRTVARRVQRLCDTFGASGRFQLGIQVARSQWFAAFDSSQNPPPQGPGV
ncbi:hypothetical protein FYJ77_09415 [Schaalia hyovaginalis]|nr:hypothetical protein [Schaalia hyovaginalis]